MKLDRNAVPFPCWSSSAWTNDARLSTAWKALLELTLWTLAVQKRLSAPLCNAARPSADIWGVHQKKVKEQFDAATLQSELQALRLERDRLRESEQLYSNLVELAAIGISHVDVNGRFVHVNRRLCDMLGYTRDELPN